MKKATNLAGYHKKRHDSYRVLREDRFDLFKVYDIIKNLVEKEKIEKAIDIGCSDGSFAIKLKEDFGFDMYGMDVAKGATESCKKIGIKTVLHNLEEKMPFKENTFDLVLLTEVIEHIFDTDFLLSEINRILKKGGYLIITTPNINSLTNRINIFLGRYPNGCEYRLTEFGSGHIRVYNFKVLIEQLKENNFKIKKVTSPNFPYNIKNKKIHQKIKQIIIKCGDLFPTLSNQIVILAKK